MVAVPRPSGWHADCRVLRRSLLTDTTLGRQAERRLGARGSGSGLITESDGNGPRVYFQRVPEPKSVKNRLRLDVNAGGAVGTPLSERRVRVDEAVERLAAARATFVAANSRHGEYCATMLDPEGTSSTSSEPEAAARGEPVVRPSGPAAAAADRSRQAATTAEYERPPVRRYWL